jgi:hypothetical protein
MAAGRRGKKQEMGESRSTEQPTCLVSSCELSNLEFAILAIFKTMSHSYAHLRVL